MTSIIKVTAGIAAPFIIIFGAYLTAVGHVLPGGGLAGGFIIASALILFVLVLGKDAARKALSKLFPRGARRHSILFFLSLVLLIYSAAYFAMLYFGDGNELGNMISASPLLDIFICFAVAGAVFAAFLELSGFRINIRK